MSAMDTTQGPKFLSLYDLGLSFQDSGRQPVTRQTLVFRGRAFAKANDLRIFRVGKDDFVSIAQLERLMEEAA